MKVLVVDDSSLLRERLVEMLSEVPCVEAFGQDADEQTVLNTLLQLKPAAVIFDAQTSGGRGIAVLRKIRESEHQPTIFIFSNSGNEAYRRRCLEEGASFFFDKSTELKEMMVKFIELVGQICNKN